MKITIYTILGLPLFITGGACLMALWDMYYKIPFNHKLGFGIGGGTMFIIGVYLLYNAPIKKQAVGK